MTWASQDITRKCTFIVLLSFPFPKDIRKSIVRHRRVGELLNSNRILPSHNYKPLSHNSSLIRILYTKWLVMTTVATSGNVILWVSSTFSWSQNPKIGMSFSYFLFAISDLRELHGGVSFLLDNPSSINSLEKEKISRMGNLCPFW